MEASFVDLRKKSAEIINALKRKERVTIFYRGKPTAIMEPIGVNPSNNNTADQHQAFGLWSEPAEQPSVEQQVRTLRRRRYDDL